jgi:guanine deaminase
VNTVGSGRSGAIRAQLVRFRDDPLQAGSSALVHEPDGLLVFRDGRITACGPAAALLRELTPDLQLHTYSDCIAMPGFIDAHTHYVQAQIVAASGGPLLDWLERRTYVAEQDFADPLHAKIVAARFCDELIRNGTTTAAVLCAVYPQSVDALFEAATQRDMRVIAGKVLMDRNAPSALLDTAQSSYDESETLIKRWHGKGRNLYAITPRYAGSSTPAQLEAASVLWGQYSQVYMHSHLAENKQEVAWIRELFPDCNDYVDVYDRHGLLGPRALFAHGIYLSEAERDRLADTQTTLVHCPSANLFLGSGLFPLHDNKRRKTPLAVALGTDIGAGTSFSMLKTMADAYKVSRLLGHALSAAEAFYLATLGTARALQLDDRIGSFAPGYEADIVILDPRATPALRLRADRCADVEDLLFSLLIQGDDRAIRASYLHGRRAHVLNEQ